MGLAEKIAQVIAGEFAPSSSSGQESQGQEFSVQESVQQSGGAGSQESLKPPVTEQSSSKSFQPVETKKTADIEDLQNQIKDLQEANRKLMTGQSVSTPEEDISKTIMNFMAEANPMVYGKKGAKDGD